MSRLIDLTGQQFGRLTVLEHKGRDENRNQFWLCKCECGNEKIIRSANLKSGNTKSCGCLNNEMLPKRSKSNIKHGMCNTRIYNIWSGLKSRCNYKGNDSYQSYGARGIKVCKEWEKDFISFYDWAMQNDYNDNLSLDRIDNNGDYEPGNCRWATEIEQKNNTSYNTVLDYRGEKLTMAEIARKYNVNYDMFIRRIQRGWDIERAINEPSKRRKNND